MSDNFQFGKPRRKALVEAVGIEPMRAGIFLIPGFTLRYHVGWHQYPAHYHQAIRVCTAVSGC